MHFGNQALHDALALHHYIQILPFCAKITRLQQPWSPALKTKAQKRMAVFVVATPVLYMHSKGLVYLKQNASFIFIVFPTCLHL